MRHLAFIALCSALLGCSGTFHSIHDPLCGQGRDEYLCPSTFEPPLSGPDGQMFVVGSLIGIGGGKPPPGITRQVNRSLTAGRRIVAEAKLYIDDVEKGITNEYERQLRRGVAESEHALHQAWLELAEQEAELSARLLHSRTFFEAESEGLKQELRALGRLADDELVKKQQQLNLTLAEVRRYLAEVTKDNRNNPFVPEEAIEAARQAETGLVRLCARAMEIVSNRAGELN